MDIKQNLSSGQTLISDHLAKQSRDEQTETFLFNQLSIRTMAKDIEALSKKTGPGPVSLYTKPAKTVPETKVSEIKTTIPPAPPSPPGPIPAPAPKIAVPPPGLPIAKEEKPAPPVPEPKATPTPEPTIKPPAAMKPLAALPPKPSIPSTQPTQPKKPLLKKLALIAGLLIIISLGIGGWFYWRNLSPSPSPSPSLTETPSQTPSPSAFPLVLPSPLFEMEKQEVVELMAGQKTALNEILQPMLQLEQTGIFSQIVFKISNGQEKIPKFEELTANLGLDFSSESSLKDYFQSDQYSVFVYHQAKSDSSPFLEGEGQTGRIGLVVVLKNESQTDEVKNLLKQTEASMPSALKGLLVNKEAAIPADPKFLDNTYKEIPIRYINFPFSTLSIDYAVVKGYLLITTSKESMYAAIDRVFTKNITMNPLESSAPIEGQIVDCGTVGPDNPDPTGQVKNCFAVKFKKCQPAKSTASLDLGQLGGLVTYYYEIIGPSDHLCSVKSKFLQNPNPDWIGKEMICEYDNTKDFEIAIKDMGKCSGPLYDLMGQPKSAL